MTKTLTKDEFYDKYGDVKVKFKSYYKYIFTFCGVLQNGNKIFACYGGHSDLIYRVDVDADYEVSISGLEPYSIAVYDQNENLVEEYTENNF